MYGAVVSVSVCLSAAVAKSLWAEWRVLDFRASVSGCLSVTARRLPLLVHKDSRAFVEIPCTFKGDPSRTAQKQGAQGHHDERDIKRRPPHGCA